MLKPLYDLFLKEKEYLDNLAPNTLKSYRENFKRYERFSDAAKIPTKFELSKFVIGMREGGMSVTTCNISIRSFNSFLTWLHTNGHLPEPLKIQKLKEEKRIMKTFDEKQIAKLIKWKPQTANEFRLYAFLCTLSDTGARVSEILNLELTNVLLENLLIKVTGKGRKERFIPISRELRKVLYRYQKEFRKPDFPSPYLFCTKNGTALEYHNMHRDVSNLFEELKISDFDGFFHAFRRFYGRNFIKHGGNVFYLQQIFGHAELSTTRMYCDADLEDLQNAHLKSSPLSRLK